MEASEGALSKSNVGVKETIVSVLEGDKPQEVWISDEEFYTEGSSDEDDMALRIKRRERREAKREKATGSTGKKIPIVIRPVNDGKEIEYVQNVIADQDCDDSRLWRPKHGSSKFKKTLDSEQTLQPPNSKELEEPPYGEAECEAHYRGDDDDADAEAPRPTKPFKSLSEAYSSMHKLDALLRHSDQRLKEAQAETLRAQLTTRAHLRQLRHQTAGHDVLMARNWDAFMKLCPAMEPGEDEAPQRARSRDSVLPRISGPDSDRESEDSDHSTSALAITDEEKIKLAALLRDLDRDLAEDGDEEVDGGSSSEGRYSTPAAALPSREGPGAGYNLDAEARRSLENIDGKLQELVPDASTRRLVRGATGAKAGTRQQRLEDIDRCLQALATSALEDVEPVGEEEVQALLQEARGWSGAVVLPHTAEPALIHGLLQEARKELPHFRYRHHQDADDQLPGSGATLSSRPQT